MSRAPLACLAGPDELVFAFVALDEVSMDRDGEGWIVELEREVFGARFAGGAAPAGSELETAGGDAKVGRPFVVAVAWSDGCLDVED